MTTSKQIEIVCFALPPIAVCVTMLRLFDRFHRKKVWWDDAWAGFSMIFACSVTITSELRIVNPSPLTKSAKVALYYMSVLVYYAAMSSARLSITLTVIRLCPRGITRTMLQCFCILFVLSWCVLSAQVLWVCETEIGWKEESLPQCRLGLNVGIAYFIVTTITDSILIFAPLKLLWHVHLQRWEKIRLMSIFASTAVFTAFSLYRAYAVLRVGGLTEILASVVEYSVGLIVANLSVIVGWLHRVTERQDFESSGETIQWRHRHIHIRSAHCASIDSESRFAPPPCSATIVAVNITRTTITDFDRIDRTNSQSDVHEDGKWEGRDSIEMSPLGEKNDKDVHDATGFAQ